MVFSRFRLKRLLHGSLSNDAELNGIATKSDGRMAVGISRKVFSCLGVLSYISKAELMAFSSVCEYSWRVSFESD